MKIRVNGQEREISEGKILSDFLEDSGYKRERIAVELNGEIAPKTSYEKTVLQDGDVLEVVSFVGGG